VLLEREVRPETRESGALAAREEPRVKRGNLVLADREGIPARRARRERKALVASAAQRVRMAILVP